MINSAAINTQSINGTGGGSPVLTASLRAGFEATYDDAVSMVAALDSVMGYVLSAGMESRYEDTLLTSWESLYDSLQSIAKSFPGTYAVAFGQAVIATLEGPYGFRVMRGFEGQYAPVPRTVSALEGQYGRVPQVVKQLEALYAPRAGVRKAIAGRYALRETIRKSITGQYTRLFPITAAWSTRYAIEGVFTVRKGLRSSYSIQESVVISLINQPRVLIDDRSLPIHEARIWTDEGDYLWQCEFTVGSLSDYTLFLRDTPFEVDLYGERYAFVTDVKSMRREDMTEVDMRVSGVGLPAQLASPRYVPFSKEYAVPMLASEIVTDLVGSVTWDMVDWVIPARRFTVEEADPINAARLIVEAAGGVLESRKDGTLLARPLFPVSLPDYPVTPPAHTLTDFKTNFSVDERFDLLELFNRYRIYDYEPGYQDRIDYEPFPEEGAVGGTLRGYPSPYREHVQIIHTWDNRVQLVPLGFQSRIEEEVVEIYEGQGETRFPIHEILDMTWYSQAMGLTFDSANTTIYSTDLAIHYGLVKLTYRTVALEYTTNAPPGVSVQYLLEDTAGG